jgi:hypothetical protein
MWSATHASIVMPVGHREIKASGDDPAAKVGISVKGRTDLTRSEYRRINGIADPAAAAQETAGDA